MNGETPSSGRRVGCIPAAVAWVLLVVLAPFAAVVRSWRRLRRGTLARVRWAVEAGEPLAVVDLTVDVPSAMANRARRNLVDAVVRVAEELRRPDDLYNLIWREATGSEAILDAVGPRPQELAQRLDTALSHWGFDRRTQLWVTLPRGVYLGELVDPLVFDPEAEGAAAELFGRSVPRWAMEVSFARGSPSTVYRLRLHVPGEAAGAVEDILSRLRERLGAHAA